MSKKKNVKEEAEVEEKSGFNIDEFVNAILTPVPGKSHLFETEALSGKKTQLKIDLSNPFRLLDAVERFPENDGAISAALIGLCLFPKPSIRYVNAIQFGEAVGGDMLNRGIPMSNIRTVGTALLFKIKALWDVSEEAVEDADIFLAQMVALLSNWFISFSVRIWNGGPIGQRMKKPF